jgi:ABC-type sugar transport system ATPase subunit
MWGIRPEDIRLDSSAPGPDSPQALVDLVEGLGSDAHVSLKIEDVMLVARTPGDDRPDEETNVTVHLDMNKLHLFDSVSEIGMIDYS